MIARRNSRSWGAVLRSATTIATSAMIPSPIATRKPSVVPPPIAATPSQDACASIASSIRPIPRPQPSSLDRRSDRVDQSTAEQRRVQRVREHARARADRERGQRRLGLIESEADDRDVESVQDVLEELEAEPDERADKHPVVRGPDEARREPEQQEEARSLGRLLRERRGERGRPVGGEGLPEQLRVDRRASPCSPSMRTRTSRPARPRGTRPAPACAAGARSDRSVAGARGRSGRRALPRPRSTTSAVPARHCPRRSSPRGAARRRPRGR